MKTLFDDGTGLFAGPVPVLSLFIPGAPQPAGSKSAFVPTKRGTREPFRDRHGNIIVNIVDSTGKRGKEWRRVVQHHAGRAWDKRPLLNEPLLLRVTFHLPRPKAHYTRKGLRLEAPRHHTQKPDALKLTRALEDALTGVVWTDDCLIVKEIVAKRWTEQQPGCRVVVERFLPHEDREDAALGGPGAADDEGERQIGDGAIG